MLQLEALRFDAGRTPPRVLEGQQEVLYVTSGSGLLHLGRDEHTLEEETAALLLPGESYVLETEARLELVSVTAPGNAAVERNDVTIRLADCLEQRADEHRTFRVLHQSDITQFVGVVQPSRAPSHSHPYDEVGYILEGRGLAHVGGRATELGPGSRFHLAPGEVHCIENSGPGAMRILGVFFPAGSPAQRS